MPIKLGTKVRLKPYPTAIGQIIGVSVKHDPPRYDIRFTNGAYMYGRTIEELEVLGGGTGADATAEDDGPRVSKRA